MSLSLFTTLALAIRCFYEPIGFSADFWLDAQAEQAGPRKIIATSLVSAQTQRYSSSALQVAVSKPAHRELDSAVTAKAMTRTGRDTEVFSNEVLSKALTKTTPASRHVSIERSGRERGRATADRSTEEIPSAVFDIANEQGTDPPEEEPLIVDDPNTADLEVGVEAIVPPPFSVEDTQADLLEILELDTQVADELPEPQPREVPPWAATAYAGRFVSDDLGPALIGNLSGFEDSGIVGFGLSRTLAGRRPLTLEAEGQVLQHFGNQGHSEATVALILRWHDFPWDDKIDTTFAIGEGLSFATDVPELEIDRNGRSTQLLNYLLFELTFALPQEPDWQLVGRLHHRSGVYGLFDGVGSGSNIYTAGIRRRF